MGHALGQWGVNIMITRKPCVAAFTACAPISHSSEWDIGDATARESALNSYPRLYSRVGYAHRFLC